MARLRDVDRVPGFTIAQWQQLSSDGDRFLDRWRAEEDFAVGPDILTPGEYAKLAVIDTGCGMNAETAASRAAGVRPSRAVKSHMPKPAITREARTKRWPLPRSGMANRAMILVLLNSIGLAYDSKRS